MVAVTARDLLLIGTTCALNEFRLFSERMLLTPLHRVT